MKNKAIERILFVISIGLLSVSYACTEKFAEYNTNQHEATEEMMKYDNLKFGAFFAQMQKNVFPISNYPTYGDAVYQIMQNLTGDSFSGYMGAIGQWNGGSNFTTYNLQTDWRNYAFERGYAGLMLPWSLIKKEAKNDNPSAYAVATIVKVAGMHRITDMYGPLPYLKFGSVSRQYDYDSQELIYNSFFEELEEAIKILTDFNAASANATILAKYDYLFGGKVVNWIKFANTLRLRLAIRIVYVNPEKARIEAEKSVAHPIGVITNATEYVRLNQVPGSTFRHPLWVIQTEFEDTRMGATIDSYMNGYGDPRLPILFKPTSQNKFTGVRNGIIITSKELYSKGAFSLAKLESNSPILWMSPSEAYFLRAEGAIRGWNMNGTAKELYNTGIQTSFEYLGAGSADNYINDETSTPADYVDPLGQNSVSALGRITIKWDENASFETKLERIITQKYISMFPDGQEAWSEFRRTTYPKIFPNSVNQSGGTVNTIVQVRRIPFPLSEYMNNPEGVATGISSLGGDDNGGTKLWWDKKP